MALNDYFTAALFDQLREGATGVGKSYIEQKKMEQLAKYQEAQKMRDYLADSMKTQRYFVPEQPGTPGYFESPTGKDIAAISGTPERNLTVKDIPDIARGMEGVQSEPYKQPKELRTVNVYTVGPKGEYKFAGTKQGYEDEIVKYGGTGMAGAGLGLRTEQSLRSEYLNQAKPYIEVRNAYNRIKTSAQNPSAAGDLSLIFNYMKMLDPGSVVREGEFATAQNSASVPDVIRAKYNKVKNGERLAEAQRADFVKRSDELYNSATMQQKQNIDEYTRLAKEYRVDPKRIIVDLEAFPETESTSVFGDILR